MPPERLADPPCAGAEELPVAVRPVPKAPEEAAGDEAEVEAAECALPPLPAASAAQASPSANINSAILG